MTPPLVTDAFVVHCARAGRSSDSNDAVVRRYESITILERPEAKCAALQIAEDQRFSLLMRGHLYTKTSPSLNPQDNLRFLLAELNRRASLAPVLDEVAGGMFSLFVVDRLQQTLSVLADRLGCMPLYYLEDDNGVFFSNNQFSFAELAPLSEEVVGEYLKYGYLPFSDSLFESVRRIRPGQILTVAYHPEFRVQSIVRPWRRYLPPAERIQTPAEGAQLLSGAFDRFFGRLGSGRGLSGLSGGYDSRLIAAYTTSHDVSLINFGNPDSREVRFAKRVAQRLGKSLESFRIPPAAVAVHGERFKHSMPTLDSFEDAHIFELVDRVMGMGADYYVDGFIGDTVVGSGYYYSLGKKGGLLGNLLLRNRFQSPVQNVKDYVSLLYNNKRAVSDEELPGVMTGQVRAHLMEKAHRLVEEHLSWCPTHEDVVEGLTHTSRGQALIAGGPVAISAFAVCACPFIDHEVFDIAMKCAKHVRSGDRLYNALWRQRFVALADIPKSNTGGCAQDGDRIYRFKHFASATLRRTVYPALKKLTFGHRDWTENYSSVDAYLGNFDNRRYLRTLADRVAGRLPTPVANSLLDDYLQLKLSPTVTLRIGTLLSCLA